MLPSRDFESSVCVNEFIIQERGPAAATRRKKNVSYPPKGEYIKSYPREEARANERDHFKIGFRESYL